MQLRKINKQDTKLLRERLKENGIKVQVRMMPSKNFMSVGYKQGERMWQIKAQNLIKLLEKYNYYIDNKSTVLSLIEKDLFDNVMVGISYSKTKSSSTKNLKQVKSAAKKLRYISNYKHSIGQMEDILEGLVDKRGDLIISSGKMKNSYYVLVEGEFKKIKYPDDPTPMIVEHEFKKKKNLYYKDLSNLKIELSIGIKKVKFKIYITYTNRQATGILGYQLIHPKNLQDLYSPELMKYKPFGVGTIKQKIKASSIL